MSIKTIAVDSKVYEKLASHKGTSESFSKAIDRLLSDARSSRHTGADVLAELSGQPDLTDSDAKTMLRIVEENRANEVWHQHDLP